MSRRRPDAPSLAATTRPGKLLVAVAAGLVLVAAVAVSSGLRTQPVHRIRLVAQPPDQVVPLDPTGCPIGARCTVRPTAPEDVTVAVRRAFPAAAVQWQTSTVDGDGRVGRVFALYALNGDRDSLMVSAECQSGPTRVDPRREMTTAQQRSDLAGNQIPELTVREIVAPGPAGCTADLVVTAVGDATGYDAGLRTLSADPTVQAGR